MFHFENYENKEGVTTDNVLPFFKMKFIGVRLNPWNCKINDPVTDESSGFDTLHNQ